MWLLFARPEMAATHYMHLHDFLLSLGAREILPTAHTFRLTKRMRERAGKKCRQINRSSVSHRVYLFRQVHSQITIMLSGQLRTVSNKHDKNAVLHSVRDQIKNYDPNMKRIQHRLPSARSENKCYSTSNGTPWKSAIFVLSHTEGIMPIDVNKLLFHFGGCPKESMPYGVVVV